MKARYAVIKHEFSPFVVNGCAVGCEPHHAFELANFPGWACSLRSRSSAPSTILYPGSSRREIRSRMLESIRYESAIDPYQFGRARALIVIAIDHVARESFSGQSWNLLRKLCERVKPAPDLRRGTLLMRRRRQYRLYHSLLDQSDSEFRYGDTSGLGFASKLALDLGRYFERQRHREIPYRLSITTRSL
jgi:hypothetical protein